MKSITDLDFAAELAIRISHLDTLAYPITTDGLWIHARLVDTGLGWCKYTVRTCYNQYGDDATTIAEFNFTDEKAVIRHKQLGHCSGFSVEPGSDDSNVALLIWIVKGVIAGLQI